MAGIGGNGSSYLCMIDEESQLKMHDRIISPSIVYSLTLFAVETILILVCNLLRNSAAEELSCNIFQFDKLQKNGASLHEEYRYFVQQTGSLAQSGLDIHGRFHQMQ